MFPMQTYKELNIFLIRENVMFYITVILRGDSRVESHITFLHRMKTFFRSRVLSYGLYGKGVKLRVIGEEVSCG